MRDKVDEIAMHALLALQNNPYIIDAVKKKFPGTIEDCGALHLQKASKLKKSIKDINYDSLKVGLSIVKDGPIEDRAFGALLSQLYNSPPVVTTAIELVLYKIAANVVNDKRGFKGIYDECASRLPYSWVSSEFGKTLVCNYASMIYNNYKDLIDESKQSHDLENIAEF